MSSVINLFNVAYMCSGRRTRNISLTSPVYSSTRPRPLHPPNPPDVA